MQTVRQHHLFFYFCFVSDKTFVSSFVNGFVSGLVSHFVSDFVSGFVSAFVSGLVSGRAFLTLQKIKYS